MSTEYDVVFPSGCRSAFDTLANAIAFVTRTWPQTPAHVFIVRVTYTPDGDYEGQTVWSNERVQEGIPMYTITIRHEAGRNETIAFPRDTTPQEIIDAATLYSKPFNVAEVHADGHVVALARHGTFSALEDSAIGQFMRTTHARLFA